MADDAKTRAELIEIIWRHYSLAASAASPSSEAEGMETFGSFSKLFLVASRMDCPELSGAAGWIACKAPNALLMRLLMLS